MKSIVVFGGTFDPFHNGHLAVARTLRDELDCERVLVAPTGQPWLRDAMPIASGADRLRMVELGLEGESGVEASDVDIRREGVTYSIDTVGDVRSMYSDHAVDIVLAIGADAVPDLAKWRRYSELMDECRLAVVRRPGADETLVDALPRDAVMLEGPMVDVSASAVRAAYARGDLARAGSMVPPGVHRFILEKGIYVR